MSQSPPQPTPAELSLLRVLWRLGPSTVRHIHGQLEGPKPVGYTTVLKLLQIMVKKGLVEREREGRSHVYRAQVAEGETQDRLIGDLLDRAFEGSASKLVMRALHGRPSSRAELEQIRKLVERMAANEDAQES